MIFVFWMLSFKPTFSLSSLSSRGSLVPLHFLPEGACHLSIWGYWYFSLRSCANLFPACASFSLAFHKVPGGSDGKMSAAMWETRVRPLGWEDSLEKEMATDSSTLAWKIPWTREPGRLQSMGSQRVRHDWATSLSFHFHSAYKLNKQGDSIQPWCAPFPIWNQFIVPCLVLTRNPHVAADGIISFFFMAEQYSIVYMYIFFIHLSVNGHLGCSHVLATVNSAAVNIGIHISF